MEEFYLWHGEKKLESKMKARWINASYYRGGTSKGVFFRGQDLPTSNQEELNKIFLDIIGSPDPNGRQLNGMGGGVSSLSKCVIVSPSKREGIDVDYTFIQIAVDQRIADWSNNCGNLSSAVGPFAVNEAIKKLDLQYPVAFVEHAKGYVPLGGISIIIAVACKHRKQVYDFSRFIIEEIKKRTPIWKKEHYINQEEAWLEGKPIENSK